VRSLLDEANKERGDLRLRVDEMALKAMVSGASANGDGALELTVANISP
jgi:hypothetical protein